MLSSIGECIETCRFTKDHRNQMGVDTTVLKLTDMFRNYVHTKGKGTPTATTMEVPDERLTELLACDPAKSGSHGKQMTESDG
ncbi:hypothetical protein D3C76_440970 [compost metagenome]